MRFLKENKLAILSIGAIVICAILLALPEQFAHFGIVRDSYTHYLSGYQFFFNTAKDVLNNKLGASIVGSGVAIIVLAAVSIALICLWKKSSFFVLLASLVNLTISILFFTMESAAEKAYPKWQIFEGRSFVGWPTYVCGALMILVAIYLGYKAVMMMKDEIKHPSQPKGPKYNYLKK